MQFASSRSVFIILAPIHITDRSSNVMTECTCGVSIYGIALSRLEDIEHWSTSARCEKSLNN